MSDKDYIKASEFPMDGERSRAYFAAVRSHAVADDVMRELAEASRVILHGRRFGFATSPQKADDNLRAALARYDRLVADDE